MHRVDEEASGLAFPHTIALDADALYVACLGGPRGPSRLVRVDKRRPAATTIAESRAGAIEIDATHVYWAEGHEIRRAPKAGGPPFARDPGERFRRLRSLALHDGVLTFAAGGVFAVASSDRVGDPGRLGERLYASARRPRQRGSM